MNRLALLLLAAAAAIAQTSTVITIIPITNPTTGAPADPGSLVLRDLTGETAKISAPDTLVASYRVRLWDENLTGCVKNTASGADGQLSIGSCALPALDTTVITQNAADPTKQFRFSNAGITAGQTRVGTLPDADFTFEGININQIITGVKLFNANQQIAEFLDFGPYSGSFTKYWSIDGKTASRLAFRDSGGTTRAALDYTGVPLSGGGGVAFEGPSGHFQATATNSPSLRVRELSGQSANVLEVVSTNALTKYFEVSNANIVSSFFASFGTRCLQTNNSGVISVASAGCGTMTNPLTTTGDTIYSSGGTTPARLAIGSTDNCKIVASGLPAWSSRCLLTDTTQTVTGVKTFTANQAIAGFLDFGVFSGSFTKYWSIDGNTASRLNFRDSGSTVRAYLNYDGVPLAGGGGIEFAGPSGHFQATATNSPSLRVRELSGQSANVLEVVSTNALTKYFEAYNGGVAIAQTAASIGSGQRRCMELIGVSGVISYNSGGGCVVAASSPLSVSSGTVSCSTCVTTAGGQSIAGTTTLSTLSLGSALSGTFNMSGNLTVTGNMYGRTYSGGDASCGPVANGWWGIRTDNGSTGSPELQVCIGGVTKKSALI